MYRCRHDDYLFKPFNRQQLANILSKWLGVDGLENNEYKSDEGDVVVSKVDNQILDLNKLEEMRSALGDVFSELIPAYIGQSDEMINDMMSLLDKNDLVTLERYAHSMKSSSINVGVESVSQLSKELETMARNHENETDIRNMIESVVEKYKDAKRALLEYIEGT